MTDSVFKRQESEVCFYLFMEQLFLKSWVRYLKLCVDFKKIIIKISCVCVFTLLLAEETVSTGVKVSCMLYNLFNCFVNTFVEGTSYF